MIIGDVLLTELSYESLLEAIHSHSQKHYTLTGSIERKKAHEDFMRWDIGVPDPSYPFIEDVRYLLNADKSASLGFVRAAYGIIDKDQAYQSLGLFLPQPIANISSGYRQVSIISDSSTLSVGNIKKIPLSNSLKPLNLSDFLSRESNL